MSSIVALLTPCPSNIESLMEKLPEIPITCKAKCEFGIKHGSLTTDADIEVYDNEELIGILHIWDDDEDRQVTVPDREENEKYRPILNLIANYLQDNLEIDFMSHEIPFLLTGEQFEYEFTLERPYIG